MTPDTRLLLCAFGAVVVLIVLIARLKLHPLIALTTVSLALGVVAGMPLGDAVKAFQDGVGAALGFIAIVVHRDDAREDDGGVRRGDANCDHAHPAVW
jgi:GntP family gluconate:H+ symporter